MSQSQDFQFLPLSKEPACLKQVQGFYINAFFFKFRRMVA